MRSVKPERWQQIDKILKAALEREETKRSVFLDEACAGDEALRKEVESLLAADQRAESLIEEPALEVAARAMAKHQAASLVGSQIGSYKVLSLLGTGGMGEVYLAEEQTLERKVALKFLPEFMQQDPVVEKRFLREAKSAAALDHPFICKIYEVGEEEGKSFISMEYVPGETLKDQLEKDPLPPKDTLAKATEIAEALEAAHERNIVHRDLKPSNIMITPDGHVKVLDFGLAKRLTPADGGDSQEKTLTANLTQTGDTLGTVPYMSPEQLRGQEIDARSDIFSFGVVLYEMLTGVHPFQKDSSVETANAVLNEAAAPVTKYLDKAPGLLQHTVRKMLAKEPDRRYQSVHEVGTDLAELASGSEDSFKTAPDVERPASRILPWAVAGVSIAALLLALLWQRQATDPVEPTPMRFRLGLSPDQSLHTNPGPAMAISPDGKRLAYAVTESQGINLYVRALDELEGRLLAGTEGAHSPFFSPDGQWVGFAANQKLKKVAFSGGAPLTLCGVPSSPNMEGASWAADDTIVFARSVIAGLSRVPAAGGMPEEVTVPDLENGEDSHRFPQVLPGGEWVLFSAGDRGNVQSWNIVAQSLETGERRVLQQGGYLGRYLPTGHLVFMQEATLFAAPFDPNRLELTDSPVPILEGVRSRPELSQAQFDFSRTGTLVYLPGGGSASSKRLVWVDREGREEPLAAEPHFYRFPRISPDGKRMAVVIGQRDLDGDIWIYDLVRETLSRFTFDPARDDCPVWTPDGQRLLFASSRQGAEGSDLFWKRADGTGQVEQLITRPNHQDPNSFTPDGKRLVFSEWGSGAPGIGMVSLGAEPIAKMLIQGRYQASSGLQNVPPTSRAEISPDGRFIAYRSYETGRDEIYVRPFPNVEEGKWQISGDWGVSTVWAPDGRELFYRSGDRMMVVRVETEPTFKAGSPEVLFTGSYSVAAGRNYDIHPDGQRFLMLKDVEEQASARSQLTIVLNWFEELKQLVPTE